MADQNPQMRKFADYLLANYTPASSPVGPVTIEQRVPVTPPPTIVPMDPAAYRLDRFMRTAPSALPPPVAPDVSVGPVTIERRVPAVSPVLQRQLAQAAALRGGRAGGQR